MDNETGILSDSKIVETANGDLEVPAAAHHVATALGSFDEAEATLQVGDNGVLAVDESALEPTEVSAEAANLAREVEEEAAADSTAGGLAEPVPVPTQFAHSAEDDPETLLVIEEADLEKEIGTQSGASRFSELRTAISNLSLTLLLLALPPALLRRELDHASRQAQAPRARDVPDPPLDPHRQRPDGSRNHHQCSGQACSARTHVRGRAVRRHAGAHACARAGSGRGG